LGKDSQSIRQVQYCPFIFDSVFPLEKRVKAAHTFPQRGDFKGAMSKFRKNGAMAPDALPEGERVRTAVALRYQPVDEDTAPKVVASGRGWIAEKILEAAFAHGIRVREDADLAEILAAVDLDEEIPVEAFVAVAEILRYVYAANGTQPPEISSR
jgi:flagellar biosynthesis protein